MWKVNRQQTMDDGHQVMAKAEIKIRCLLYLYFFLFLFFCDTLIQHPIRGYIRVHIFNQPISDEPNKYLGIKTEYMPRTGAWLVNIFYLTVFHMIWWSKMPILKLKSQKFGSHLLWGLYLHTYHNKFSHNLQ